MSTDDAAKLPAQPRLTRREFLRRAGQLGMGAAGASLLAALPGEHHGWGHRASPSLRMIDGLTTVQQQWFPVPAGNFDISRCRLRELV